MNLWGVRKKEDNLWAMNGLFVLTFRRKKDANQYIKEYELKDCIPAKIAMLPSIGNNILPPL